MLRIGPDQLVELGRPVGDGEGVAGRQELRLKRRVVVNPARFRTQLFNHVGWRALGCEKAVPGSRLEPRDCFGNCRDLRVFCQPLVAAEAQNLEGTDLPGAGNE